MRESCDVLSIVGDRHMLNLGLSITRVRLRWVIQVQAAIARARRKLLRIDDSRKCQKYGCVQARGKRQHSVWGSTIAGRSIPAAQRGFRCVKNLLTQVGFAAGDVQRRQIDAGCVCLLLSHGALMNRQFAQLRRARLGIDSRAALSNASFDGVSTFADRQRNAKDSGDDASYQRGDQSGALPSITRSQLAQAISQ